VGAFEAPPRPAVGFVASSLLLAYDARDPAPRLRLAHIDFAHVEALPSGEVRFFFFSPQKPCCSFVSPVLHLRKDTE